MTSSDGRNFDNVDSRQGLETVELLRELACQRHSGGSLLGVGAGVWVISRVFRQKMILSCGFRVCLSFFCPLALDYLTPDYARFPSRVCLPQSFALSSFWPYFVYS